MKKSPRFVQQSDHSVQRIPFNRGRWPSSYLRVGRHQRHRREAHTLAHARLHSPRALRRVGVPAHGVAQLELPRRAVQARALAPFVRRVERTVRVSVAAAAGIITVRFPTAEKLRSMVPPARHQRPVLRGAFRRRGGADVELAVAVAAARHLPAVPPHGAEAPESPWERALAQAARVARRSSPRGRRVRDLRKLKLIRLMRPPDGGWFHGAPHIRHSGRRVLRRVCFAHRSREGWDASVPWDGIHWSWRVCFA
jgi:hypothetical protein